MDIFKNENTRKRKRGLETTRRILDAAADLFARNGYDGVSVREIAEKVGIKESSLYNHFKSKSDILEALFNEFTKEAPLSRPSDSELDKLFAIMEPEEIFKTILFNVGKQVSGTLANTAMIIHSEQLKNMRAAKMYYQYMVNEPSDYYQRLIDNMIKRGMIKPINSRIFAEQYNYVSIVLTREYFMAQNGLADIDTVVRYMIQTIHFFCGLMKDSKIQS